MIAAHATLRTRSLSNPKNKNCFKVMGGYDENHNWRFHPDPCGECQYNATRRAGGGSITYEGRVTPNKQGCVGCPDGFQVTKVEASRADGNILGRDHLFY